MSRLKRKLLSDFKKLLTGFLSLLLVLSNVATVYANDYAGQLAVAQNDTQIDYVGNPSSDYGILPRKVHLGNWEDTKMVFCIEHGVELKKGLYVNSSYSSNMPVEYQQATRIAYLGWYSKYGDQYIYSDNLAELRYDYAYTQMMIWESQGTGSTFTDPTVQRNYEKFRANVNEELKARAKFPSFDGQNVDLNIGETVTLTDTNKVLSGYNACNGTVDGINIVHEAKSNDLKITATESCNIESFLLTDNKCRQIGLYRHEGGTDIRYYNFKDDAGKESQKNIYTNFYPDDPVVNLTAKINLYGSLELTKTNDKDKLVDGSVFRLKGKDSTYSQDITVTNGKIKVEQIPRGTYLLTEIQAPTVNNPDGAYRELTGTASEVVIVSNETTQTTVVNAEKQGKVNFTKTLARTDTGYYGDATATGATYKLTASEDIKNANGDVILHRGDNAKDRDGNDVAQKTTDTNGNITWSNLWLGKYTVSEVKPSAGTLLNNETVQVTPVASVAGTNNEATVTATQANTVKKQKIRLFKSGEKEGISGVVKGLQGAEFTFKLKSEVDHVGQENAKTYEVITTNSNGLATTDYLPYGRYLVRETKTPKDYITSPDFTISVEKDYTEYEEDEQVKYVAVNNAPFSAYVKLIKKDYATGKKVSLNSASIKFKNTETNKYVTQKVSGVKVDTFKTNSDNKKHLS